MSENSRIAVCLFAKAPLLGRVKTRMQPMLTPSESLALHCDLLRLCCDNLSSLDRDRFELELHVTERSEFLIDLASSHGFSVKIQKGANLGARMSHAVRQSLMHHRAVLLVGADCPSVDAPLVERVGDSLRHNQVVMVPALDGGYVALGLTEYAPELFCNIPWGNETVARETAQRIKQLGWSVEYFPAEADIDRPDDLKCLRGKLDFWSER